MLQWNTNRGVIMNVFKYILVGLPMFLILFFSGLAHIQPVGLRALAALFVTAIAVTGLVLAGKKGRTPIDRKAMMRYFVRTALPLLTIGAFIVFVGESLVHLNQEGVMNKDEFLHQLLRSWIWSIAVVPPILFLNNRKKAAHNKA